jgi:hypothetical protein
VYIRIFNKSGETHDIEDPSQFGKELLSYVGEFDTTSKDALELEHQQYAIESLKILCAAHKYVTHDLSVIPDGPEIIFSLLERTSDPATFASAAGLVEVLCDTAEFIDSAVHSDPPCVWRLIYAITTTNDATSQAAWSAAEKFAIHPEGLACMVANDAIPHLLGTIFGVPGYASSFNSRNGSASLIAKCLLNSGAEAAAMLRRYVTKS